MGEGEFERGKEGLKMGKRKRKEKEERKKPQDFHATLFELKTSSKEEKMIRNKVSSFLFFFLSFFFPFSFSFSFFFIFS